MSKCSVFKTRCSVNEHAVIQIITAFLARLFFKIKDVIDDALK
jgi:hypothetical protein